MPGWTYEDPTATIRDAVRLEMGDTKEKGVSETMLDAELQYCANKYGLTITDTPSDDTITQVLMIASDACEILAGRYAKEASYAAGGISEVANLKAQQTQARATKLRKRALAAATLSVGGLSLTDKETAAEDTDLPQPSFSRGMMENA